MQCNILTDILDLVYLRFVQNVQRVHLSAEEPATSKMLEPFGEVGGDVPEYFSSRTHFAKIVDKKSYCEQEISLKKIFGGSQNTYNFNTTK